MPLDGKKPAKQSAKGLPSKLLEKLITAAERLSGLGKEKAKGKDIDQVPASTQEQEQEQALAKQDPRSPGSSITPAALRPDFLGLHLALQYLEEGRQPGAPMKAIDAQVLPDLVQDHNASTDRADTPDNHPLRYYRSPDELIADARNGEFPDRTAAVVQSNRAEHYFAVQMVGGYPGKDACVIVYDSAILLPAGRNGSFGAQVALSEMKEAMAGNPDLRLLFVETGIQKSPKDCAIFALELAKTLQRDPTAAEAVIEAAQGHPGPVVQLYGKAGSEQIKDREGKICAQLPISVYEHAQGGFQRHEAGVEHRKPVKHVTPNDRYASYANSIEERRVHAYVHLALPRHPAGGDDRRVPEELEK